MKKTIAKLMAAVMLAASMPAMVMPTFTVEAAQSFSTSVVKFNGTYQNGKVITGYDTDTTDARKTNADSTELILKVTQGMTTTGNSVWNTHLQYNTDSSTGNGSSLGTLNKLSAHNLNAGSSIKTASSLSDVKDYYDQTGTVKSVALDSNGELIVTLDSSKMNDAKLKELAAGTNNKIEFTPWVTAKMWNDKAPAFTIQIGEVYTTGRTQVTGVSTPDGFIEDATITVNKDNTATLVKVSDNDKKVKMKGQKIEVSYVEVGGVEMAVRKLDEQCLKSAKMKRLTAKNVKNIETGAVRGCKKLTRVTMGNTKIKKIHSNAFYDCEKLKNIKINCKNLKSVGSHAFKGLKKNCTISIKAKSTKKYKEVVKKIKKSGVDKVKFKKV